MKFKQYKSKALAALLAVFALSSCNQFDLDINTDPNNPLEAAPELLLANSEYNIAANLSGNLNYAGHGFMGMMTWADDYNLSSGTFNNNWRNLYAGPLKDIEGIIKFSNDNNLPHYRGIARILKAYTYVSLVDNFDDVPFTEASKGDDPTSPISTPKFDTGQDVYNACFTLLDDAIRDLAQANPVAVKGDIIYNGDAAAWARFAKTLKMKMLITTRLVNPADATAKIKAAIAAGGMISKNSEDFRFQFSKLQVPDNRHPWYQATYAGENGFTYISSQLMIEMLVNKDPRFPFYFRRQTTKVLNQNDPTDRGTTPCSTTPGCQYGYIVLNPDVYTQLGITAPTKDDTTFLAGIFGRDRSDPAGVPADPQLRTMPGMYPCGGFYDTPRGTGASAPGNNTAPGGGIFPGLSYFNLLFYQVEAALALGITEAGDPRANFEKAMRENIAKVIDFGMAIGGGSGAAPVRPAATAIDAYVNAWLALYDAAPSNEAKLDVVMKQLWFSTWGNGYEIYNAYRRTGYPTTLQTELNPDRKFPFRLPYPEAEVSLNPNAKALEPKGLGYDNPANKVFWDKN
jgi:hypothetical protein